MDAALTVLEQVVGDWTYEMTHQALPGTVIGGVSSFELMDGDRFVIKRDRADHPDFPGSSLAVIGGDEDVRMHYFDSRGIVRIFGATLADGVLTFLRDKPDFSSLEFHQRMTWTFSGDGRTFEVLGEISHDGSTWEEDVRVTYRRS